jgi:hypothetical protein
MERPNYFRAAVCGLVATYVMSIAGHWEVGIGLPRMDPSKLMAFSLGKAPYWVGGLTHYVNGLILGMMYARWQEHIPGANRWMKGVTVGVVTMISAQIISGIITPFGFIKPLPMIIASILLHVIFGVVLAYAYSREGGQP